MTSQFINPIEQIRNPATGQPVLNAQIYFGKQDATDADTNPASRINVYSVGSGGALTLLAQPVRTNAAGNPVNSAGAPVSIQVDVPSGDEAYSLLVKNAVGAQILYVSRVKVDAEQLQAVAEVASLKGLPTGGMLDGEQFSVGGFYAGSTLGGGTFVFSASQSKSAHNGGTIIAPEALFAWNGTRANLSALNSWTGSGTGCYVRVGAEYHIYEFGGGDGVNNDSQILQSLINATPAGAYASIAGARCVVDGNVTVIDLRTLAGGWTNPDLAGPANAQQYANARSAIILNSAATITIGQSASVKNVLVYRKGMTFPVSDDSLYAGTAFVSSSGTCSLSEMLVMGFNKLFVGTNQRYVIDRVFGDNRNGIEISGSPDVCYLSRCHMWPFAADTIIYPNDAANRGGVAYYLHDVADWVKLDSCFSYAYKIGYDLNNVSSITAVSCSADHNFPNSQVGGSKGFVIRGDCKDTMLQNLQAAAQTVGVEIDVTDADRNVTIMGGALWSNTTNSIIVKNGSAKIGGGVLIRDSAQALGVASASSRVEIDDATIRNIATPYVIPNVTSSVYIGENIRYEGIANGALNTNNLNVPSIASVGNILLPATGNIFAITGTNAINFITGYYTRKEITLIFENALTVLNGGAGIAGLRLSGNANFVTQQGSTLTLRHNGNKWFEVARSV